MSLIPPSMRDQDRAPLALGPAIKKPAPPSPEDQRAAQVQAFERGDHQPDGSVMHTDDPAPAYVAGIGFLPPNVSIDRTPEQRRRAEMMNCFRASIAYLLGVEEGELWPDEVGTFLLRLERGDFDKDRQKREPPTTVQFIWPQPCESLFQSGGSE